jgi:hypothetical protein
MEPPRFKAPTTILRGCCVATEGDERRQSYPMSESIGRIWIENSSSAQPAPALAQEIADQAEVSGSAALIFG